MQIKQVLLNVGATQLSLAEWWLTSRSGKDRGVELLALATECGVEVRLSAVKAQSSALKKLRSVGFSAADSRLSLSSWVKVLGGVSGAAAIETLVQKVEGGASVAECMKAKPKKVKPVSVLSRFGVFWRAFSESLRGIRRFVAGLALLVAQVEFEATEEPEVAPTKVDAILNKGPVFTLAIEVVEGQLKRPDEVRSEVWAKFSDYEKKQALKLLAGETVVCSMHNFVAPYTAFIYWAKERGQLMKIDRSNKVYGNPFRVGEDGTLPEVIEKYRAKVHADASFLNKIPAELQGKALACWCKKGAGTAQCHGDVLAEIANRGRA